MPRVWVVRAGGGSLVDEFLKGEFASIGFDMGDLTDAKTLEDVRRAFDQQHPGKFPPAAGNISGQIHSFLNEMDIGDIVVTPTLNSGVLRYGEIRESEPYFEEPDERHRHGNRRRVDWHDDCILRSRLPEEERKILKDRRTIFLLSHSRETFLALPSVGQPCDTPFASDPRQAKLLANIHTKNPGFFELLIAELLKAMGCVDLDVRGGPGDQGIDVAAYVQVPFAGNVEIHVQAKRYKPGRDVDMRVVNRLKSGLSDGARGLVITTSDFKPNVRARAARDAEEVSLVNGPELAEQLIENWDKIPEYFRDQLGPLSGQQ